jgi:hypothetical protein
VWKAREQEREIAREPPSQGQPFTWPSRCRMNSILPARDGRLFVHDMDSDGMGVIQEQFGRGPPPRYCHVSATYCISTLPLGNVAENERVA